jgi:hypothetical protein
MAGVLKASDVPELLGAVNFSEYKSALFLSLDSNGWKHVV